MIISMLWRKIYQFECHKTLSCLRVLPQQNVNMYVRKLTRWNPASAQVASQSRCHLNPSEAIRSKNTARACEE